MNHKIIFTEDKMFVNGAKVKDYKKSLPKEYGINYEDDLPKETNFVCKKCGAKLEYDIDREEDSGGNSFGVGIFNCTNEECGQWYGVIYPTDKDGDMVTYRIKPNYNKWRMK